jgi:broad specificity phosphatase PhoE
MDDVELSHEGVRQAVAHGDYMRQRVQPPVAIYSSVAWRAQHTAILAWGFEPITVSGLHELDWGEWERQPRTIADSPQYQGARARLGLDFVPPGGESPNMVLVRAQKAIGQIVQRHPSGLVLVYAHNSVIKTVVGQAMGGWSARQFDQERAAVVSLTAFRVGQGGSLQLQSYNQPAT